MEISTNKFVQDALFIQYLIDDSLKVHKKLIQLTQKFHWLPLVYV